MYRWTCYIKPTRRIHLSGFRMFEVGYCILGSDNKVEKKVVISTCTDAVHFWEAGLSKVSTAIFGCLDMDLTIDGYIRIWSNTTPFRWSDFFASDVIIKIEPIDTEWCEREWEKRMGGDK